MIITFVIIFTILAAFRVIDRGSQSKVFPLKFGRDTKVISPTPVCLFILYAAMTGTNEIYVTIIDDLPVLLTPV